MTLQEILDRVAYSTDIRLFAPEFIGDFENLELPKLRREWGNRRIIAIAATAANQIAVYVNRDEE